MDSLKKKSLLVVGGTGFIGTVLLKRANQLGMTATSLSLNKPTSKNLINNISYVIADTSNLENLEKLFLNKKFNYIVNLAGYINHDLISGGGFSIIESQLNLLNNLVSIFNCKELIRFIQIGSSDEYGLNKSPQTESVRENPISPYSFAKSMNTQYLQMLNLTEHFPAVIIRLFLVYGPHQKFNRLIPFVIKSCLNNNRFNLSEGSQIRDFCYVEDVVDAIIKSLSSNNINGHILNIGSGENISVKEIVKKICTLTKLGEPKFNKKLSRLIENKNLFPDISKAKKLLNWKPKTSLDVGLTKTILWYKEKLNY